MIIDIAPEHVHWMFNDVVWEHCRRVVLLITVEALGKRCIGHLLFISLLRLIITR
jgi:hypothetical protein